MMHAFVISALSFAGTARPTGSMNVQMAGRGSKATFPAPVNEIGADVETGGFWDPRGYSTQYSFEQLRTAEIKHGRAAMLATVGFFVQEVYRWPNSAGLFQAKSPLAALSPENTPPLGLLQIIGVVGLIEWRTRNYPARAPGDIGFDPLGLSANGIRADYQLAELKNGRLAMIASIAFIVQTALTGKGIIESTFDVFS
mmetsp:Transcript_11266/g.38405  ORF Transcript_11266/g.38405 Transcript_11266/m.38405 type:complete len:198 (+) Transcript_11266:44-637(+)